MILKNKNLHFSQIVLSRFKIIAKSSKTKSYHKESDDELKSEYVILDIDYESYIIVNTIDDEREIEKGLFRAVLSKVFLHNILAAQ